MATAITRIHVGECCGLQENQQDSHPRESTMNRFQKTRLALSAAALALGMTLPVQAAVIPSAITFSSNDVSLVEGNAGSTAVFVRFSLSQALAGAFDFSFNVLGQTATSGSDYTSLYGFSGSAAIPTGNTWIDIQVADILGDLTVESDETFSVVINSFSAMGGEAVALSNQSSLITIVNDDAPSDVPEPSTAALAGLALLGALAVRRRRA